MGTIYRPTATLFLLLKLRRLSEQDLSDCLDLLRKVAAESAPLDTARVLAALDGLAETADEQLRARRARLRSRLSP